MDISIFLTQALGIIFAILGLSVVMNRKIMAATLQEMVQSQSFLWVFGFITLIIGTVLIVLNNVWTSGLPLFVTVLGWLALIKGAFILFFPDAAVSWYKKWNTDGVLTLGGLVAFILGLVLLYLGYM